MFSIGSLAELPVLATMEGKPPSPSLSATGHQRRFQTKSGGCPLVAPNLIEASPLVVARSAATRQSMARPRGWSLPSCRVDAAVHGLPRGLAAARNDEGRVLCLQRVGSSYRACRSGTVPHKGSAASGRARDDEWRRRRRTLRPRRAGRNHFPTRGEFSTKLRCPPAAPLSMTLPACRAPAAMRARQVAPARCKVTLHPFRYLPKASLCPAHPAAKATLPVLKATLRSRKATLFRPKATPNPAPVSDVSAFPPTGPPPVHVHSFGGERDCSRRGGFPYPGSHEARVSLRPIHGPTHGPIHGMTT